MTANNETGEAQGRPQFPATWRIAADYDPNQHLMNLKGRDYMDVANRLLWFIRDQRDFIVRGLAVVPYIIRTELVEMDRESGYAHFKTYIRDVLGNEATAYGSETARDFGDYAEKAGTKSTGRALLNLGYGTAFAPEMDEGARVVDAPRTRRPANAAPQHAPQAPTPIRPAAPAVAIAPATTTPAVAATTQVMPAAAAADTKAPAGEMTRQQFLTAVGELGLNPRQAMDNLGVRSLEGLNLTEALENLRSGDPAPAGKPAIPHDLQLATRDQQIELSRIMLGNAISFDTNEAQTFLNTECQRPPSALLDAHKLRAGTSDLTLSEYEALLETFGLGDPDHTPAAVATRRDTAQRNTRQGAPQGAW